MTRQPIQTEYKGVAFRSKSEAIFAYTLDRAGVHWFYEPRSILEGHGWDFLVFWPQYSSSYYLPFPGLPGSLVKGPDDLQHLKVLIEYKPAAPSDTYVARLCDQVSRHELCFDRLHFIVFGSPWGQCCDYISLPDRKSNSVGSELCGNFLTHCDEGRTFRFDLRS